MSLLNKSLIAILVSCLSISTFAFSSSGSYGGSSRGGDYGDSRQYRKPIDQNYELGKAVYKGTGNRAKLQYCIDNGSDKVKLKSKSAKSFKRKSVNDFAAALYHCDKPDTRIASSLNRQDLAAVVYYLNKRYRLKLKGI